MKILDHEGYPTDEYLKYIATWNPEVSTIEEFLKLLESAWWMADWGFVRNGNELELHTGGWSGNESIIESIKRNLRLTHFSMTYEMWKTGGHYYFKIRKSDV